MSDSNEQRQRAAFQASVMLANSASVELSATAGKVPASAVDGSSGAEKNATACGTAWVFANNFVLRCHSWMRDVRQIFS
jgi:hypothetical protein